MQTAHWLKQARESFEKLGVIVDEPELDFGAANEWKRGVVAQMTGGVASLFKANGVDWLHGKGSFKDANTLVVEGNEEVTSTRRSSRPDRSRSARRSRASTPALRGLDGSAGADRGSAEARDPRRRDHRLRVRVDLPHFGSEVTVIEMLDRLIPQEDDDAAKELPKAFSKKGITLELGKQCTAVEEAGGGLTVRYGETSPSRPT